MRHRWSVLALLLAHASGALGNALQNEPPDGIIDAPAIWTGKEMIVWGGGTHLDSGARYDPVLDAWLSMEQVAGLPEGRNLHAAAWTGSELFLWGGNGESTRLQSGALYDPSGDRWRFVSVDANTPPEQSDEQAVWTGSVVIVWGRSTGGRYDPVADRWSTVSATGAPSARTRASVVWTGSRMVVWGGANGPELATGARYDPVADVWSPTSTGSGAPTARREHSAVWTGSRMVVWGGTSAGVDLSSGASYDPASDAWSPISTVATPLARSRHTGVWSGSEMIVWGGRAGTIPLASGGAYDAASDSWRTIASAGAPTARHRHVAVWTGRQMIVWGGRERTGGRYDPVTDSWSPTHENGAPPPRSRAAGVWTGTELVVWGGRDSGEIDSGGRYDPVSARFRPIAQAGAPAGRWAHTAVWTGTEVIVWGGHVGYPAQVTNTGGRYDPGTDTWRPTSLGPNLPTPRRYHSAVWTGSEMIVWGGSWWPSGGSTNTGGRYDPVADAWQPTSTGASVPQPNYQHAAVWTGSEMIVWGYPWTTAPHGGRYDPVADVWTSVATTGAPPGRLAPSGVWTGTEMIVWGGRDTGSTLFDTGGRYDPATDTWRATSLSGVPPARAEHTAVWTGTELIVWGGYTAIAELTLGGGRYDPATDSWRPTSVGSWVPSRRAAHVAVFTGREMLIWGGGLDGGSFLDSLATGGGYDPAADSWGAAAPPYALALAGKAVAAGSADASIRAYRMTGSQAAEVTDAFPNLAGAGVRCSSLVIGTPGGGDDVVLAAPGPVAAHPPKVRGFDRSGGPVLGLDFLPYGAGGYGANVGSGAIDGMPAILTGPGPSSVYGPHVRAFRYVAGTTTALAKVSFFAYSTLRYGVLVGAGELEGDGFDEILTGAGPGAIFGPHVRGFDYDGVAVAAMPNVSFFAYGTPRYGAEVGRGDVDGDGFSEILTGPGPSPAFGAHLRGFQVDGGPVAAMAKINAFVFAGAWYGANAAGGDLDADGFDEIVSGAGPDPAFASRIQGLQFDGAQLAPIPGLGFDVYGLPYGVRSGAAFLD